MWETPAALLLGKELIVDVHSSSLIPYRRDWYIEASICETGSYKCFHDCGMLSIVIGVAGGAPAII
jgi:hypothetical protein